jgi:hypothetical protein
MAKINVFKLRENNTDTATGATGMLTHMIIDKDLKTRYLLQPRAVNPKTGHPVEKIHLEPARLEDQTKLEEIEIPIEVLGTVVKDEASGIEGTALSFVRHPNGCFHVHIQPKGVIEKTREPIKPIDVDFRQVTGEKVPVMTEEEKEVSRKKNPSPDGIGMHFGPPLPK